LWLSILLETDPLKITLKNETVKTIRESIGKSLRKDLSPLSKIEMVKVQIYSDGYCCRLYFPKETFGKEN